MVGEVFEFDEIGATVFDGDFADQIPKAVDEVIPARDHQAVVAIEYRPHAAHVLLADKGEFFAVSLEHAAVKWRIVRQDGSAVGRTAR